MAWIERIVGVSLAAVLLAGCTGTDGVDEGPAEDSAENVDAVTDDVAENMEDAAEATGNAVEDAAEATGDAVHNAAESTEEATD